jgi:tRNA(Ile)-lysidine synthase
LHLVIALKYIGQVLFEVTLLLEKVRDTIARYGLLTPGMRVVVGFSGGVDSVCLLHLLTSLTDYQLELWALYINHELRPAENVKELELLRRVGTDWGVRTHEIKIDIPGKLKQKPQSLQLLARKERYRAFEAFCREIGAARLALAHHQDDQAETVFYRIIRGTGLDGLAGMALIRDGLYIRPLLGVNRSEILEYANRRHLSWVEDSSNHKIIYARNRIRHRLLPEIETGYNPRFKESLLRLAGLAREQHEFMESILAKLCQELKWMGPGRVGAPLDLFLEEQPYVQYCWLKKILVRLRPPCQLESCRLQKLRDRLNRERGEFSKMQLAKGVTAALTAGTIWFGRPEPVNSLSLSSLTLTTPGETVMSDRKLRIMVSPVRTLPQWRQVGKEEIYIDAATVTRPLRVRFWQAGDAFRPLGLSGAQKLHDFFIDHKVPRDERPQVPLLVDGDDRIVWVIGYRLSEIFKVTSQTVEMWRISIAEY